jgi:DNA-binding SARP family transcriptional activator
VPLGYIQPTDGLARELREVAHDATALAAALQTGVNFELPPDFPKEQLLEIAGSLAQLPNGTAEGCRAALEYARNRLPAIRREHVLSEEIDLPADADARPQVLRNSLIDERLRHLIASTTTALDEYRRLVAEVPREEPPPEASIAIPADVAASAIAQSLTLESNLASAAKTVEVTSNPNSPRADSLKRQLHDGQGLNRLARAELRMSRVIVAWYRQVVDALRLLPSLIRHTANGLTLGADIAEMGFERWHDLRANLTKTLFDEFRKTSRTLVAVADRLEKQRHRSTPTDLAGVGAQVVLRLRLIGQMEATTLTGENVLPAGRKARALLAIIALTSPSPVLRTRLAELLWSSRPREQARASLRQEIRRLLEALKPAGTEVLAVTRDHLSLRPGVVWVDVEEVMRATTDQPASLSLFDGDLLEDLDGTDPTFDAWLTTERERLRDRARTVAEALLREQVEPEAAIPAAERLLQIDRAHEGAWRALMRAHAANGERGMAIQAYDRCRAVLADQLDASPSAETETLLAEIRGRR